MARNGKKTGKGVDSSKRSKGKVNVSKKKSKEQMKQYMSYKHLLSSRKGYVTQEEAEALRILFDSNNKASLDSNQFNCVLSAVDKVIRMSTETFNKSSILGTVCNIFGTLSPHCDSEDRLKQVESFVISRKKIFNKGKIENAFHQVKPALRPKAMALLNSVVQKPSRNKVTRNVQTASGTVDLKSMDEDINAPSTSKPKSGLMRNILQVFQASEEEAIKQLISLQFQAFKEQCSDDEIEALGEVIRVLLSVDPRRENLHLTFDRLVWMQKLSTKSEKRREQTRAVASDFCKRRGTLWVVKWIAENAHAADLQIGVELVVNSLETIDLSSECITELLKKNDFVPGLQMSIAKRFSDLDIRTKEDLVNKIVNYLGKEDLSRETNMNMLIADLLVNLLWMTYYEHRSLFNLLFEALDGLPFVLSQCPYYKTVDVLYSWFKSGTISPLLVDYVKGKTFWCCERSPLLLFEFCLAVTDSRFQDSICNEFERYVHSYVFNPGGAIFVQYILSPPPIAFNDTLKRRTQEERLTTIEAMRKALIPSLYALMEQKPTGAFLSLDVRCSLTSKLIMNLNDPKMLRNVVKKVTICIGSFVARCTVDKTYPWVLRLLRENIAMDTFLYSVQMFEEETEYFSDLFIDYFSAKAFAKHTRSPVWRSLILMLIETKIPSVLYKVKKRLTHLKPPTTMKSSDEIEFWQTILELY